jgi:hypothetical protein
MKRNIITFTILLNIILLLCFSCAIEPSKETTNFEKKIELGGDIGPEIVVIDSCEYIFCWFGTNYGSGSLTHKGNCKYCAERRKNENKNENLP